MLPEIDDLQPTIDDDYETPPWERKRSQRSPGNRLFRVAFRNVSCTYRRATFPTVPLP
jgi:hypothetical protein